MSADGRFFGGTIGMMGDVSPLSFAKKRREISEDEQLRSCSKKRRSSLICSLSLHRQPSPGVAIIVPINNKPQLKGTLLSCSQQDLLFAFQDCKKLDKKILEDRSKEEPAIQTYKLSIKLQRAKLLQPGYYSRNIGQISDDSFSINISTMGISTSSTSSTPQAKSLLEIKPQSKAKGKFSSVTVKTSVGCVESKEKHLTEKFTKFNIDVCKEHYTFMMEITSKEQLLALNGNHLFMNYEIVISG